MLTETIRRAVKEGFKDELRNYLKAMRTRVEEAGYRKLAGPVTDYHFEWAALHWFAGLSFEKISDGAEKYGTMNCADRAAIHKSVTKVLRLAGITSV